MGPLNLSFPLRPYLSHYLVHPEGRLGLKDLKGLTDLKGLRGLKDPRGEAWEQEADQEEGKVHRTGGVDKEDEASVLDNTG